MQRMPKVKARAGALSLLSHGRLEASAKGWPRLDLCVLFFWICVLGSNKQCSGLAGVVDQVQVYSNVGHGMLKIGIAGWHHRAAGHGLGHSTKPSRVFTGYNSKVLVVLGLGFGQLRQGMKNPRWRKDSGCKQEERSQKLQKASLSFADSLWFANQLCHGFLAYFQALFQVFMFLSNPQDVCRCLEKNKPGSLPFQALEKHCVPNDEAWNA